MIDLELFIKWNTLHNKNSFHLFYICSEHLYCAASTVLHLYFQPFSYEVLSFPWVWRSSSLWKMVCQIYQATAVIAICQKHIWSTISCWGLRISFMFPCVLSLNMWRFMQAWRYVMQTVTNKHIYLEQPIISLKLCWASCVASVKKQRRGAGLG